MKTWKCTICEHTYDEDEGWPDKGIAPGTPWEEVPEDWICPDCHMPKAGYEAVEMNQS